MQGQGARLYVQHIGGAEGMEGQEDGQQDIGCLRGWGGQVKGGLTICIRDTQSSLIQGTVLRA